MIIHNTNLVDLLAHDPKFKGSNTAAVGNRIKIGGGDALSVLYTGRLL